MIRICFFRSRRIPAPGDAPLLDLRKFCKQAVEKITLGIGDVPSREEGLGDTVLAQETPKDLPALE